MDQDQVGMLACISAWLSSTHGQALSCRAAGAVAEVGPRQEPQLKVASLGQGSALAMATPQYLEASPHISRCAHLVPGSQQRNSQEWRGCTLGPATGCKRLNGRREKLCWNAFWVVQNGEGANLVQHYQSSTLRSVYKTLLRSLIGFQDINKKSWKESEKIQTSTEG